MIPVPRKFAPALGKITAAVVWAGAAVCCNDLPVVFSRKSITKFVMSARFTLGAGVGGLLAVVPVAAFAAG